MRLTTSAHNIWPTGLLEVPSTSDHFLPLTCMCFYYYDQIAHDHIFQATPTIQWTKSQPFVYHTEFSHHTLWPQSNGRGYTLYVPFRGGCHQKRPARRHILTNPCWNEFSLGPQGCQSESCLGGWRCKDPSEEVDRRRRGWTAYRKISRPSARSRARAKDGSGSHSELLSRMDGTGWLLRRTWTSGTGGSRGERKHSTAPGDARTFVNPTCNSSARLVKSYSKYVCDFCFLFCFVLPRCCCF